MSPGDYQYYFHTYDQFAGANGGYDAAGGVDVTIFWHNPSFPDETTECLNADQVCITCQPETSDVDGDGMAGPVPGVYLGMFSNSNLFKKFSHKNFSQKKKSFETILGSFRKLLKTYRR